MRKAAVEAEEPVVDLPAAQQAARERAQRAVLQLVQPVQPARQMPVQPARARPVLAASPVVRLARAA
jgi:hypothetical protein